MCCCSGWRATFTQEDEQLGPFATVSWLLWHAPIVDFGARTEQGMSRQEWTKKLASSRLKLQRLHRCVNLPYLISNERHKRTYAPHCYTHLSQHCYSQLAKRLRLSLVPRPFEARSLCCIFIGRVRACVQEEKLHSSPHRRERAKHKAGLCAAQRPELVEFVKFKSSVLSTVPRVLRFLNPVSCHWRIS